MREFIKKIYESKDEGYRNEIFATLDPKIISKVKFRNISRDKSTIRRWKRTAKIPFSVLLKGKNERELKNKILYLSTHASSHKVKIPELNPDIAYFVGYVSGDGHLKSYRMSKKWEIIIESWTDLNELKILNDILYKNFGIKGSISKNKTRKGWRLFINSKIIYRVLTNIFNMPAGNKSSIIIDVPTIIKNSDSNIVMNYIKGWFDAEGFVTTSHDRLQIEFYVKSKKITKWLKKKFDEFKINSNLKKNNTLIIYSSNIEKFCSLIGFRHRKQLKKLAVNTESGNTRATNGDRDYWA